MRTLYCTDIDDASRPLVGAATNGAEPFVPADCLRQPQNIEANRSAALEQPISRLWVELRPSAVKLLAVRLDRR
jgi:hypothetical protein